MVCVHVFKYLDESNNVLVDKILAKQHTLPGNVLNIVRKLSEDTVGDVRAFVSHLLPPNLGPPTELAYGYVSENARTMATFSRPPPRREPKNLVSGMNDMTISEYHHQRMVSSRLVNLVLEYD